MQLLTKASAELGHGEKKVKIIRTVNEEIGKPQKQHRTRTKQLDRLSEKLRTAMQAMPPGDELRIESTQQELKKTIEKFAEMEARTQPDEMPVEAQASP